ncbi:hypothetical protein A6E15_12480 [Natrinema saccharevitans]|uniref:DUF7344 domain-containing protein n=1 Tax=Natrinema saccharevitans TaxID=301967 RepID=A0A1S8AY96_9EURY|nr:transcriptional regulator [Natrinema saccharevitans]OLZ41750.1 hypothetical protein A6E15_12480 [Natrinema saccharevitans]
MSSDAHLGGDDVSHPLATVPTECYEVLRHPRRLRVLEILGSHETRLSLSELTTELLERAATDDTDRGRREVRVSLVHNHLPRLADYDVLEWDGDGVALVDESPVHPADLTVLLDLCGDGDGAELLETLVDPVRMRLLSVLADGDRPQSVEQLAGRLATPDGGPFADPDRAAIALHHSHFPAMAAVGVLNYDPESGLVTRYDDAVSIVQ